MPPRLPPPDLLGEMYDILGMPRPAAHAPRPPAVQRPVVPSAQSGPPPGFVPIGPAPRPAQAAGATLPAPRPAAPLLPGPPPGFVPVSPAVQSPAVQSGLRSAAQPRLEESATGNWQVYDMAGRLVIETPLRHVAERALNTLSPAGLQSRLAAPTPGPFQSTSVMAQRPSRAGLTNEQVAARLQAAQQPAVPASIAHLTPAVQASLRRAYENTVRDGHFSGTFDQFADAYKRNLLALSPLAQTGRQPLTPSQVQPAARPGVPSLPPGQRPTWLNQTNNIRQGFAQHIAPHMNEEQFTKQYFGGFHNDSFSARYEPSTGEFALRGNMRVLPGMTLRDTAGNVLPAGTNIGSISRQFNPRTGRAYNAYFQIRGDVQSQGLAKWMLKNQVDFYRQAGIHTVDVHANIDVGGYTWAKFGFAPNTRDWQRLQTHITQRLSDFVARRVITPEQAQLVRRMAQSNDPKTLWEIADLRIPMTGEGRADTLGKALLVNTNWHGSLNLRDATTVNRFNGYTANARAPGAAAAGP